MAQWQSPRASMGDSIPSSLKQVGRGLSESVSVMQCSARPRLITESLASSQAPLRLRLTVSAAGQGQLPGPGQIRPIDRSDC